MNKKVHLLSKLRSEWKNPHSDRIKELIWLIKRSLIFILLIAFIQLTGEVLELYDTKSIIANVLSITIKILFPIGLGIMCSLMATFFWELRNSANEKLENEELIDRDAFKSFFGSINNFANTNDFDTQKTAVILPSFSPTILSSDLDMAKIRFLELKKDDFPYKKNTKELGFPKKKSFTQSDIICTANLVALYQNYNMVLPVVRTDIQGLYKFFQFTEEGNRIESEKVYEMIKEFLPEENIVWNKESIIKDITNSSNRIYSTYIVVGLFSNVFLMDFLNTRVDLPDKHFKLCTKQKSYGDNNIDLVRTIEILNELNITIETPREMLITDEAEGDDYALIAKIEYQGKRIFVIGGGHSQGTEFAAMKLSQMWKSYMEKFKNKNFAILYQVNRAQKINEGYVKNSNTYTSYPQVNF